jgi:hypothetical protein
MENTKKSKKARPVIKGCDKEGEILEAARERMKLSDARYTQDYVAGLVDQGQGIWTQWKQGTTKILDAYWIKFALELDFNPFETRPELLELAALILKAEVKYCYPNVDEAFILNFRDLDEDGKLMMTELMSRISTK